MKRYFLAAHLVGIDIFYTFAVSNAVCVHRNDE